MNSKISGNSLYIDLGTTNTLVYCQKRGFVLNQPSLLAFQNRGQKKSLIGFGNDAKKMVGRIPKNLTVVRPLKEGVVADIENTTRMLEVFLNRSIGQFWPFRPELLISLPCRVTHFERDAVKEVAERLGAKKVRLLDEPLAAAIGANLPVKSSRGTMIVDVGGGTTEIAVISCGSVVHSEAVRIGGDYLDLEIMNHIRNQFHFLIGEQTAERVKISIGSATSLSNSEKTIEIGGFDLHKGIPRKLSLKPSDIFPPINGFVNQILGAIKKTLFELSPEISGDISDRGLVLAGGGSLLANLGVRITQETGLIVTSAESPLLSVALGGVKVLKNKDFFDLAN